MAKPSKHRASIKYSNKHLELSFTMPKSAPLESYGYHHFVQHDPTVKHKLSIHGQSLYFKNVLSLTWSLIAR